MERVGKVRCPKLHDKVSNSAIAKLAGLFRKDLYSREIVGRKVHAKDGSELAAPRGSCRRHRRDDDQVGAAWRQRLQAQGHIFELVVNEVHRPHLVKCLQVKFERIPASSVWYCTRYISLISVKVSLKKLWLLSFCFALFGCTTLDISENTFIRPDERPPTVSTQGDAYTIESVSVTHADGVVSQGIYLRNSKSVATVLYFGGNEFRIDREAGPVIAGLEKAGVDIFIFDYRGYGRSDGEPTVSLLKTDAVDLYRFARKKSKNRLVLYGLSMGSFIAASVAESQTVDGLVLEGAPTNVREQVSSLIPWYAKPFVRTRIAAGLLNVDNVKALESYSGPLLILTGGGDEQVPSSMQHSLYEQAKTAKKEMKVFPGYAHKGLIKSAEFPSVLRDFLIKKVGT